MEDLPEEILRQIFRDKTLSHKDLSHLSRSCQRFKNIADTNLNWMLKFRQSYTLPPSEVDELSWKQELKTRLEIERRVRKEISSMSEKNFLKIELSKSDFGVFDDIMVQYNHDRSNAPFYIMDELNVILKSGSENDNLTEKYYALKSLQHVKHAIIRPEVSKWKELEAEDVFNYEMVMVKVAAWSQPEADISLTSITSELDSLASRVLAHLHTVQPKHKIFEAVRAEQEAREEANVDWSRIPGLEKSEDLWSSQENKDILAATNYILYNVDGFGGDDQFYIRHFFIDKVLDSKKGNPITLSLLYMCVVARLGVVLHPVEVDSPGYPIFMLKWLEHPEQQEDSLRFTYIYPFARGKQVTEPEVQAMVQHFGVQVEYFTVAGPMAVAQLMLKYLILFGLSCNDGLLRRSLELMLVLTSKDTRLYGRTAVELSQVYLDLHINPEDVMNMLQDCRDIPGLHTEFPLLEIDALMTECQNLMDRPPPPKKRGLRVPFLRYNIGQVCRDKKYNDICVVHGWDVKRVEGLQGLQTFHFYNVLESDGYHRDVAQEDLEPLAHPEIVTHPQVGKYFSQFDPERGYIGNKQSKEAFPDDERYYNKISCCII